MRVGDVSNGRCRSEVDTGSATDLIVTFAGTAADDPSRPALRERAIEAWLPLAQHLGRRYRSRGEPLDDLVQVAIVGLIKAVDRYDNGRGVEFPGFAVPTIVGELKRHFRDRTWAIRVPRWLQERRLEISAATQTLTHTLGRSPTVADIAGHLGVSEETVVEGLEGARAYTATSLSAPVNDDPGSELGDTLGSEDPGYELTELHLALGPALAGLDTRDQMIITLRFYGNCTQTEIAERIGISQMQVSRLLTRALAQLRGRLTDDTPRKEPLPGRSPQAQRCAVSG